MVQNKTNKPYSHNSTAVCASCLVNFAFFKLFQRVNEANILDVPCNLVSTNSKTEACENNGGNAEVVEQPKRPETPDRREGGNVRFVWT